MITELATSPAPCANVWSLACGTRHASRRRWLIPWWRGVKTTRHIAANGVARGAFCRLRSGGAVTKMAFEFPDEITGDMTGDLILSDGSATEDLAQR
jgi:hypothetical protein